MATKRQHHQSRNNHRQPQVATKPHQNGGSNIPLKPVRNVQRTSLTEPLDLSEVKISVVSYNGFQYQLMPVEIEKDAEIGLVLGQIDGEQWVFIDEILPNGMIDMHSILKEGDYLIQAGTSSLVGVDVTTALLLIEHAYDEGRKSVTFVAARQQKPDLKKKEPDYVRDRVESKARSFVEYENNEEEDDQQNQYTYSNNKDEIDDTHF